MSTTHITKTETPEQIVEREAEESHAIHARILALLNQGRDLVWKLAAEFYDLAEGNDGQYRCGWRALGYETLGDYLGQPEMGGYGESAFWKLVKLHGLLLVQGGLDPERVASLEWTKASKVIGALKAGSVTVENAVSDVESLSQSDLVEKYVPKKVPTPGMTGFESTPEPEDEAKAAITEPAPANGNGPEAEDESKDRRGRGRSRLEAAQRDVEAAVQSGDDHPRLGLATVHVCRWLIVHKLSRCAQADEAQTP